MVHVLCFVGALLACPVSSTFQGVGAEKDRITSLPGLDPTLAAAYDQFSGFVSISEEGDATRRDIFYWQVKDVHWLICVCTSAPT